MVYHFYCERCSLEVEVEAPAVEGPSNNPECPKCGAVTVRDWGTPQVICRWMHPWVEAVYKPWTESKEVRENPKYVMTHRQDVFE